MAESESIESPFVDNDREGGARDLDGSRAVAVADGWDDRKSWLIG